MVAAVGEDKQRIEVNRNNAIEGVWPSSSTGKQVESKVRGCLVPFKIPNFYTLSPSHQSLDACMEYLM
jgi:TRAP-type C4-dicarboxylate transport system substrate-binding protein